MNPNYKGGERRRKKEGGRLNGREEWKRDKDKIKEMIENRLSCV